MFKAPYVGAIVHLHPDPKRKKVYAAIVIDAWGHNYVSLVAWTKDGCPITYYGIPFIQNGKEWSASNQFATWPDATRDGSNAPYRDQSADEQIDIQGDNTAKL